GGRADGRRSRREGHRLFGRRIPDRKPRDDGVEWTGARGAAARISGDTGRPRARRVAQSGRLREGSKTLVERSSTVTSQAVQLPTWVRLFLNARLTSVPPRCVCTGAFYFSPRSGVDQEATRRLGSAVGYQEPGQ